MIDLDSAIHQWRRTVRSGRVIHRCGSVEGQYRPSLGEVELLEEAREPVEPIDIRLGWRVEFVWRQIPHFRRRLLVSWHYIKNRSLRDAAIKAKVNPRYAEFELAQAREHIVRKLSLDNRL